MGLGFKMNWSIVWVIMGRRRVSSERRRSSCSSFNLWLLGQRWPNKEVQTNKLNLTLYNRTRSVDVILCYHIFLYFLSDCLYHYIMSAYQYGHCYHYTGLLNCMSWTHSANNIAMTVHDHWMIYSLKDIHGLVSTQLCKPVSHNILMNWQLRWHLGGVSKTLMSS